MAFSIVTGLVGATIGGIDEATETLDAAKRRGKSTTDQALAATIGLFTGAITRGLAGATILLWGPFYGILYLFTTQPENKDTPKAR